MYYPNYQTPQQYIPHQQHGYGMQQPVVQPVGMMSYNQPPPTPSHPTIPAPSFTGVSIGIPRQEYEVLKSVFVPFDPRMSNGGRFDSLVEALEFIAQHLRAHDGYFTKQVAKKYLEYCRILDGPTGRYVLSSQWGKKQFDSAFNQVRQSVEGDTSRRRG